MEMTKFSIIFIVLLLSGCATTVTPLASFNDVQCNIPKIDSRESVLIFVSDFDMKNIPNNVGVLTAGSLIKQKYAEVRIENLNQAETGFAKALGFLLQHAGYKVITEPRLADIILKSEVISFKEDVQTLSALNLRNETAVICSMVFNLSVVETGTNKTLSVQECNGIGKAVASNVRPICQRSDFGTADIWTLLLRELDETGYFDKAEGLALINAVEPAMNEPSFITLLKNK